MNRQHIATGSGARFGLSCALSTPFLADGEVDCPRLVAHARWCLDAGCSSVTVFGTTGEGASIGLAERAQILAVLVDAGADFRRAVVAGVAAASAHDAVAQARAALALDCRALLVAPPFYLKDVPDEGLYRWFARFIELLGSEARDIILYNIPSVTAIVLSIALIARLKEAFPDVVVGVKDSSGDPAYGDELLAAHRDLLILVGDERRLAGAVREGGAGSICGLANLCPDVLLPAIAGSDDPRVRPLVDLILTYPVLPAVKALIAHRTGDPAWRRVAPPLVPLDTEEAARLAAAWDAILATEAA